MRTSQSTAAKISGLSMMERIAPPRIRSHPALGSRFSFTPSSARINENSPIWARLAECQRRSGRMTKSAHDQERGHRFTDDDDEERRKQWPGLAQHAHRIEQHAHRNEKQYGKGIAQRQQFLGRTLA